MYALSGFSHMIGDRVRTDAYIRAMRQKIQPGSVVVDLGAGTGAFSLVACQLGARRVYAIEYGAAMRVVRTTIGDNGFSDRVVFLQERSEKVDLPEKADVIVADVRGVLPIFGTAFQTMQDARERLLRPGGCIIPQKDRLWTTLLSSESFHARYLEPWTRPLEGCRLDSALPLATQELLKFYARPEDPILPPVMWAEIDYRGPLARSVEGRASLWVEVPGTFTVLVWFESLLTEDVSFNNGPRGPETIYGQLALPLPQPLSLAAGDRVELELAAHGNRGDYVWVWAVTHVRDGRPISHCRQSTFHGALVSEKELHAQADDHVPRLSARGEMERHVLGRVDGRRTLRELAQDAHAVFPDFFSSEEDALEQVTRICRHHEG